MNLGQAGSLGGWEWTEDIYRMNSAYSRDNSMEDS